MRTIVHISDLHFGMVDKKMIAPLLARISEINPDLVIITGDLTQRARTSEFKAARAFIRSLKRATLVVPGNHDIPAFNIWRRVFTPFERFHRFISSVSGEQYIDDEMAVIGMNTVERFAFSRGRINERDLAYVEQFFKNTHANIIRIVFAHHPILLPSPRLQEHTHIHQVANGAKVAVARLTIANVDVFLSGHLHQFKIIEPTLRNKVGEYGGVVVQAGTTLSTRLRGEKGSFNVMRLDYPHIIVEQFQAEGVFSSFELGSITQFTKTDSGWNRT